MPSSQLCSDIWIDIATMYLAGHQDLASFASTCKLLRQLTLPNLFRSLSFDGHRNARTIPYLTRCAQRAESISKHPHLSLYIHELRLIGIGWAERSVQLRDLYDLLTRHLISLPCVQRIHLFACSVTHHIDSFIRQHRSLQSLTLLGVKLAPSSLRSLKCCIFNLTSLILDNAIPVSTLLAVFGSRPLALRHLEITTPNCNNGDMHTLLASCSELRSLDISRWPHTLDMLPHDALQNLQSLKGPLHIVCALVPGRSVRTIHLTSDRQSLDFFADTHPPDFYNEADLSRFAASKVPLRNLSVTINGHFPADQLRQLGGVVRSLRFFSLEIKPSDLAFDKLARQLDSVFRVLNQWPQLQVFRMVAPFFLNRELLRKYTRCPVPPNGDPRIRGHPSLKEFKFQDNLAWLWFADEGWTLRKLEQP